METKRYIGIDLHRNCFTACLRLENGREYLKTWKVEELATFAAKLRRTDEVAVEVTGNTRLFHDAVAPHVERVVAVNPSQFKVITHSVKKTDRNDARNLALYLAKDLLPEVRMKDKTQAQIASLTQTRDSMVKLRTALKNKVNNICSAHGVNLHKESLASEKGLKAVLALRFDPLVNLELKIIIDQIHSLNQSIAELEETIGKEGQKLEGHKNLTKLGRTTLIQCALIAQRYSPYLKKYYERIKSRRGTGKAIVALARKFLGIIYRTLKNQWVFEDFPNFVLAEEATA